MPISLNQQIQHVKEITAYYAVNIYTATPEQKREITAKNKAIIKTFEWFEKNETKIKLALQKTAHNSAKEHL